MSIAFPGIIEMRQIDPGTSFDSPNNGSARTGKCFVIGTDGNLDITWASGRTEVIPSGTFTTGVQYWCEFKSINSPRTTASNIIVGFDS